MAAARSADRPGTTAGAACGSGSGSGSGPGSSPSEDDGTKCAACAGGPCGASPPCGHPACPRARRHPAAEERLRRRSDPEKRSGRTGRRELFACPALFSKSADIPSGAGGKHKLPCDDREEFRRHKDDTGVLSDSENEEPVRRIRNVSAFVRKTKASLVAAGGAQRSRSCTDPVEVGGRKLKVPAQVAMMDQVGIGHSYTAGILLSSENSRSVSAPLATPDRRPAWRAVVMSWSSTPLVLPLPQAERSISPESNDSISEELNHFKPIVCSPCTPPKRLPDGRLLEPTIVKSTPRNLTRGLQKSTSYEASPAVLQKWRQIELDRQNLKENSKATLTSPVADVHSKTGVGEDTAKTHVSAAGGGLKSTNKRRLLFDPPTEDADPFQKQSVMIRVPAIRYSSDVTFRGSSDCDLAAVPESCGGGAAFSRKQSLSPYSQNSGFQSCKLVQRDSQSPRKESNISIHNQPTSRRGQKRQQKTKHLDSGSVADLKRSRPVSRDAFDERYICQVQQERQDRVLALKLQRQFDLENQTVSRRRSPDAYFLRSWMSNQTRRRRGLRRSRRINKKY